jgi:hypothetical protein
MEQKTAKNHVICSAPRRGPVLYHARTCDKICDSTGFHQWMCLRRFYATQGNYLAKMATEKLTMAKVEAARRPGLLGDGGGLYLHIGLGGSKSWAFRFTLGGRQRRMGLGSLNTLNLREARERARECRKLVDQGIDPIDQRRSERSVAATKRAMTFRDAALTYIKAHEVGWTPAHARQWRDHFEATSFPRSARCRSKPRTIPVLSWECSNPCGKSAPRPPGASAGG